MSSIWSMGLRRLGHKMNTQLATLKGHNLKDGDLFFYFGCNPDKPRGTAIPAYVRRHSSTRHFFVSALSGLEVGSCAAASKFWACPAPVKAVQA